MTSLRLALATAAAGAALLGTPADAGVCVRNHQSPPFHEVCYDRDGCLVYVWTTMPPTICAN